MKSKAVAKTEVVILENDSTHLHYLTSFVKTLTVRVTGDRQLATNPISLAGETEARKKLSSRKWELAKRAGCIVLDIDLGEGAREAGITWIGEIARNAETPIVVVTGNRARFKALNSVYGLAPFLVIDKPRGGLPEDVPTTPDENLARFNDILSQAILSACYIAGRLEVLRKAGRAKDHLPEDVRALFLWMLHEHPVRTLVGLSLAAVISLALLFIALTHWHVI